MNQAQNAKKKIGHARGHGHGHGHGHEREESSPLLSFVPVPVPACVPDLLLPLILPRVNQGTLVVVLSVWGGAFCAGL